LLKTKYFNITINSRKIRHIRPASPTNNCFCPGYATAEVKGCLPKHQMRNEIRNNTRILAPDALYNQVKGKAIKVASVRKIGTLNHKDS
jgi:hypothetical protein